MTRKTEPVKTEETDTHMGECHRHPAMGMVQFNRVQRGGRRKLHGSALEQHMSTIMLRVYNGKMYHSGGEDFYSADHRLPIVELELSAAQFAELLTTMNVGDGIPCTLRYVNGGEVPEFDDDMQTEQARARDAFAKKMQRSVNELRGVKAEIEGILESRKLPAKVRQEIEGKLQRFINLLGDSAPFAIEMFHEVAEKVVTHAKAEVDAFMSHAIHRAGIAALAEQGGAAKLLEAPELGPVVDVQPVNPQLTCNAERVVEGPLCSHGVLKILCLQDHE